MHISFWLELAGRLGTPIFAATLVGCLLDETLSPVHGALLATGFALIAFDHWLRHHRRESGQDEDTSSPPRA